MRRINIDRGWKFRQGTVNFLMEAAGHSDVREVNLPHDFMLESEVKEEAPSGPSMGYYDGGIASYTKYLEIPEEWKNDKIYLSFDGVMQNATVEINGSKAALHHYGYTPFQADITSFVNFGEPNRVTVTVNASMQPNSRWYTGAGIYRHVELVHTPLLHIDNNGIFAYTRRIEFQEDRAVRAYAAAEVTVINDTAQDHMVKVEVSLKAEQSDADSAFTRSASILVKAGSQGKALVPITAEDPLLWDAQHPDLYRVNASLTDMGVFRTCLIPASGKVITDSDSVLFGIRTVTADSTHGLCVNGETVKLKGGCIHHDNGILGAVSLFDSEYRKLKLHKESGFNAVRTAHNPPSAALLEACDRLGLYVLDEAFDAWGMGKQPGDYNQFFQDHWKEDMRSFILRDRNHPSILLWSTGNEIVERGGLGDGYKLSAELAEYVRSLDSTRLVTNGLCSYWSGLDDKSALAGMEAAAKSYSENESLQNAPDTAAGIGWEERSEAFASSLDVVGYNYMEDRYEIAGKLYPERVIAGTESYPMEIDRVWELVERLPYVIGDFTWTSYDYIGEAGIGKSVFLEPDDPLISKGPLGLVSHTSQYPWRLANDADFDINGNLTPQGSYRKIVWGSSETFLYSQDPAHYGKTEVISRWGWPDVTSCWNWSGQEERPVQVVVYSSGEEVELLLNGSSLGRQPAGRANRFMTSFDITYRPGILEAVSYNNNSEISRSRLVTAGTPAAIRLCPEFPGFPANDCVVNGNRPDGSCCTEEKNILVSNGCSLVYISVEIVDEDGNVVPDAQISLSAEVSGAASLAGFGSANPITSENYTSGNFTSYRGRALAVIRSGYETGNATLTVRAENMLETALCLTVK